MLATDGRGSAVVKTMAGQVSWVSQILLDGIYRIYRILILIRPRRLLDTDFTDTTYGASYGINLHGCAFRHEGNGFTGAVL